MFAKNIIIFRFMNSPRFSRNVMHQEIYTIYVVDY